MSENTIPHSIMDSAFPSGGKDGGSIPPAGELQGLCFSNGSASCNAHQKRARKKSTAINFLCFMKRDLIIVPPIAQIRPDTKQITGTNNDSTIVSMSDDENGMM